MTQIIFSFEETSWPTISENNEITVEALATSSGPVVQFNYSPISISEYPINEASDNPVGSLENTGLSTAYVFLKLSSMTNDEISVKVDLDGTSNFSRTAASFSSSIVYSPSFTINPGEIIDVTGWIIAEFDLGATYNYAAEFVYNSTDIVGGAGPVLLNS
jgi:hypothetical protein